MKKFLSYFTFFTAYYFWNNRIRNATCTFESSLADDFPFCFHTSNIPYALRLKMGLKKAFFFKTVHFI